MACNMLSVAAPAMIPSTRVGNSQVKTPGFANVFLMGKTGSSKVFCHAASLEEEFSAIQSNNFSNEEEIAANDLVEEPLQQLPPTQELKELLGDSQRTTLVNKLSEANYLNRLLKRQITIKETALGAFKNDLSVTEREIHALVGFTQEIAKSDILEASRKMNQLQLRLGAVRKSLKEQINGVDAVRLKEVQLFWHGEAKCVDLMGSFNGWSQPEALTPDCSGDLTTFSTTLVLRPGRYEIKFKVDGEWQLSPELPIIGKLKVKKAWPSTERIKHSSLFIVGDQVR